MTLEDFQHPFFEGFSAEQMEVVRRIRRPVRFEPGAQLFAQGDPGDAAYFIQSLSE